MNKLSLLFIAIAFVATSFSSHLHADFDLLNEWDPPYYVAPISEEAATAVKPESPVVTHRVPQFENEHVRVWKTVIMPNQPLNMHRHDCSRVVVGLKGGTLKKHEESGEISDLVFESGKAYWLTEDAPGTRHADINESNDPIEVMVIEIKALDKANVVSSEIHPSTTTQKAWKIKSKPKTKPEAKAPETTSLPNWALYLGV